MTTPQKKVNPSGRKTMTMLIPSTLESLNKKPAAERKINDNELSINPQPKNVKRNQNVYPKC